MVSAGGPKRPGSTGDLDRPRLVASDLDGTLLRTDGSLSGRTAAAWSAAADAGIETVIVTARPPRWLHDLERVVGRRGTAICGNGAFVYEVATRQVVEAHCFERSVVDDIVADLRRAVPSIAFAAERASGPFVADDYPDPHRDRGADRAVHGSWRDVAAEPVGKLLALAPHLPLEEFLAVVEDVVGDRGHLHFSGAHGLAELNAPGVTKAAGLERWATGLGIEAGEVWAFGDMPNDLPMLEWAGVGWAVANGHEQVRRAADRECPANDDDGVAHVLEAVLAQKV
ncbi:hydrolase [Terrabacter tumescens]|uniref:Hydrolase n=1 Tax=Terrabacter tumescens TaxID=60443 RepID=A0ABQ2HTP9_9MICO|nr:HAD family hydrolase [Terrabacter tumescens]GGM90534.1 hydrolase [Terrabacter tumescens]